eukprot:SRR837773.20894.p4 GENE.SRR837773.20894~~SRR837773.20894.p4  ORF type:complete len:125 (-),score=27.89 SRR837773.20894:834-1184(-)
MEALGALLWASPTAMEEQRAALNLQLAGAADGAAQDDLDAFLRACSGDAAKAADMWRRSQTWREATLPIPRTEAVERILSSPRFRSLGFNQEDPPRLVLVFDAMWGHFTEGESEAT